jgi:hypothetical protein
MPTHKPNLGVLNRPRNSGWKRSAPQSLRPAAPPVYKPHLVATALQPKAVTGRPPGVPTVRQAPTAPPVYRPQQRASAAPTGVGGPPHARFQPLGLPGQSRAAQASRISSVAQRAVRFVRNGVSYSLKEEIERRNLEDVHWTGAQVTMIRTESLWSHWHTWQKNSNIYRPAVEKWKDAMRRGNPIDAIILDGFTNGEEVQIRTLDGRHRLTAAHELGLQEVGISSTPTLVDAIAMGLLHEA